MALACKRWYCHRLGYYKAMKDNVFQKKRGSVGKSAGLEPFSPTSNSCPNSPSDPEHLPPARPGGRGVKALWQWREQQTLPEAGRHTEHPITGQTEAMPQAAHITTWVVSPPKPAGYDQTEQDTGPSTKKATPGLFKVKVMKKKKEECLSILRD